MRFFQSGLIAVISGRLSAEPTEDFGEVQRIIDADGIADFLNGQGGIPQQRLRVTDPHKLNIFGNRHSHIAFEDAGNIRAAVA